VAFHVYTSVGQPYLKDSRSYVGSQLSFDKFSNILGENESSGDYYEEELSKRNVKGSDL
jgi:hypothetical protein